MNSFCFIHDEKQIIRFENLCKELLILSKDKSCIRPALLLNLHARDKYLTTPQREIFNISASKFDKYIQRKLITENVDLINTIHQFEIKLDGYKCKENNLPYPENTLSIYMNLNPHDQVKALHKQYISVMNDILNNNHNQIHYKFDSLFYKELNASPCCKLLIELDIDTKDKSIILGLFNLSPEVKSNIFFAIETHGGYHFIYWKDTFPNDLYHKLNNSKTFDYTEDSRTDKLQKNIKKKYITINSYVMIPIPGVYHGGFPCRFIDIEEIEK